MKVQVGKKGVSAVPFLQCVVATGHALDVFRSHYVTSKLALGDLSLYRATTMYLHDLFATTPATASPNHEETSSASAGAGSPDKGHGGGGKRKGSFAEPHPASSTDEKPAVSPYEALVKPLRELLVVPDKRKALHQDIAARSTAVFGRVVSRGAASRRGGRGGSSAGLTRAALAAARNNKLVKGRPEDLSADGAAKIASSILSQNSYGLLSSELLFAILENYESNSRPKVDELVPLEKKTASLSEEYDDGHTDEQTVKRNRLQELLDGVGNMAFENDAFKTAIWGCWRLPQPPSVYAHHLVGVLFPALFAFITGGREAPGKSFACLIQVWQGQKMRGSQWHDSGSGDDDNDNDHDSPATSGGIIAAAALQYSLPPRHFAYGIDHSSSEKAMGLLETLVHSEMQRSSSGSGAGGAVAGVSIIAGLLDDLIKEDERLYAASSLTSPSGGGGDGSGGSSSTSSSSDSSGAGAGAMARDYAHVLTGLVASLGWDKAMALLNAPLPSVFGSGGSGETAYSTAPTLLDRLRPLIVPHLAQVRRHLDGHGSKQASYDLMTALGLQERVLPAGAAGHKAGRH
jgi:hypothetical protein